MNPRFYRWLIIGFCVQIAIAAPTNEHQTLFDVSQANKKCDQIASKLSIHKSNLDNLQAAEKILSRLMNQANQCVNETQEKLNTLEIVIQQTTDATKVNKTDINLGYLNQEKTTLATRQSQCRLFALRAKKTIHTYQMAIEKLQRVETFKRGLPLWSMMAQMVKSPLKTQMSSILFTVSLEETSWQAATERLPERMRNAWFWSIGFSLNLLIASLLLLYRNHYKKADVSSKLILGWRTFLLALIFSTGELFAWVSSYFNDIQLIASLAKLLFVYALSLMLIEWFSRFKKIGAFSCSYAPTPYFFRNIAWVGSSLYMLIYLFYILAETNAISPLLAQFFCSLLLLSALSLAGYFIVIFCNSRQYFLPYDRYFKQICFSLLAACAVIDILGYHTLANHLTYSSLITCSIVLMTVIVNQMIQKYYKIITRESSINHQIVRLFGYEPDENYLEILVLRITLQLLIMGIALFYIVKAWRFTTNYFDSIYTQFLHGFHWINFNIYPLRITAGIMAFCILYLLFRVIATAISRQQQSAQEEETQVVIASILTYIGFAIALMTSLMIAGIDFTGLAIVAGALSVGIGLGLQSIVNNFVSGLILLIEKPIKPGDRINIDNVDGFVKHIRVRSTQIITPAQEAIIIPNSDLITRRVKNYMCNDRYLSITCQINVAYGTDVQLVKKLLLQAALNHDEVIKAGRLPPTVLFLAFGKNHMKFQIVCLIRNTNKQAVVKSDLNFAIEQLFREHSIHMGIAGDQS